MPVVAKEVRPGVPDYSTVHEPIGELYPPIKDKSEWGKFKLSKEQVDQFWREGFLLNIPVLTHEQCDRILEDYRYFLEEKHRHPGHDDLLFEFHSNQSGDPENVLMHCLGTWRMTPLFHDLAFMPNIVVPASQLVVEGEEKAMRLWHDQLFAKPAKHGGVVAWHQDFSYWTRTSPMMHVTVHMALEDQTLENGTLQYIAGSHRWTRNGGQPLPVLDFNFKDMEGIKTILTEEELPNFKPRPALLKKGEASFHHALAVHGSYGNKSDRPRRAAVMNYFGDGVISNSDEPLLKGVNIPKGSKMEGQFHPLVYDPKWTQ